MNRIIAALHDVGIKGDLTYVSDKIVKGHLQNPMETAGQLGGDIRFISGFLSGLHDVCPEHDRQTEFRSIRGTVIKGSLQVVMCDRCNRFEADIDKFSPYDDVWGFLGHSWEVISNRFKNDHIVTVRVTTEDVNEPN